MYRWLVSWGGGRDSFTSAMLCYELNPSNSTKYLNMLILFIPVSSLCYKKINQIRAYKSVILTSDERKERKTPHSPVMKFLISDKSDNLCTSHQRITHCLRPSLLHIASATVLASI